MAKNNNQGNLNAAGTVVAVGAAVAAASAAAYLLFGASDSKKNRKVLKGWVVKMKGEIIENLEKANHVTEPVYHKIVDNVSARYSKLKTIDQAELSAIVGDIKKHWKQMSKSAKPAQKAVKKAVKTVKKAVKTVAKAKK